MLELPEWFQADVIFSHDGQWFFGSESGLHIGPYREESLARQRAEQAASRLLACASTGEQMLLAERLLKEEWEHIKRESGGEAVLLTEEIDMALPEERVREGEPGRKWYRSERFYQIDDAWFLSTREGVNIGPYKSLEEARHAERRLIAKLVVARSAEEALEIIHDFKHRPTLGARPSEVRFTAMRSFHRTR